MVEADLAPGSFVTERYEIVDLLSESSQFSRVFSARCTDTSEIVCLKVVRNSKECFDQSLDEVKLLWHLNEKDVDNDSNGESATGCGGRYSRSPYSSSTT
jgi:hypothetical protein